ncbi:MAG: hypothetical protein AABW67_00210 [Nanoarchaeota archaeon]
MMFQQISSEKKILFLKKFTEQILINSLEKESILKGIDIEKLKQKFIEPNMSDEESLTKFRPIVFPTPMDRLIRKNPGVINFENLIKYKTYTPSIKQIPIRNQIPSRKIIQRQIPQSPQTNFMQIQPIPQELPQKFSLGKLDIFLKDKAVLSIECQGPGKNVLVKKYDKINLTKTILSQQEITGIINKFSEEARIPVVGGIIKAAVGDLVISAIISEFVGSRFIINKITPYNLIK